MDAHERPALPCFDHTRWAPPTGFRLAGLCIACGDFTGSRPRIRHCSVLWLRLPRDELERDAAGRCAQLADAAGTIHGPVPAASSLPSALEATPIIFVNSILIFLLGHIIFLAVVSLLLRQRNRLSETDMPAGATERAL